MPKERKAPAGAKITKDEEKNEAAEKMAATAGKGTSMDAFLQAMKEAEERSMKPLSGDFEIIKDVSPRQLLALQGIDVLGRPTGEPRRLYGWDPQTKTACVLKLAYIEKAKNK